MKNTINNTILFIYINLLSCLSLWGDEIITKDGSRIIGNLILFEDSNLTFQTEFAGKIRISTSQIKSFITKDAISVRLDDNRSFESKILRTEDEKILI